MSRSVAFCYLTFRVGSASGFARRFEQLDGVAVRISMLDKASSYDKEVSQDAVNADVIAALAEETHQPVEIVKDVYEEQFAQLSADARITDYLVLFASRRTRDLLVHRRT